MTAPRPAIPLLASLLITLFFAACGGGDAGDDAGPASTDDTEAAAGAAAVDAGRDPAPRTAGGEQASPATPSEEVAEQAAGAPTATATVDRGREVFFSNGCNSCHGNDAQGGIGPTLAQTQLDPAAVIDQVRRPRGVMPPFAAAALTDQDLAGVHAWLHTLALPDRIVPGEGTP